MRQGQYHGQLPGHCWDRKGDFSFWLMETQKLLFLLVKNFVLPLASSLSWYPDQFFSKRLQLWRNTLTTHEVPLAILYLFFFFLFFFLALSFYSSIPHCFLVIYHILVLLCHPHLGAASLKNTNNSWWCSQEISLKQPSHIKTKTELFPFLYSLS